MFFEEFIKILGIIICVILFGVYLFPPSDKTIIEVATKNGFSKVVPGNASLFSCSDSDRMGRKFTAINVNGMKISGIICCGLLKNCTIRF